MRGNPKRVITLRVTEDEEQALSAFAQRCRLTRSAVLIDGAKLLMLLNANKIGANQTEDDPVDSPRLI